MKAKPMITLNRQQLTESEFSKKKEELEKQPGVRVVRVAEGVYKTELRG